MEPEPLASAPRRVEAYLDQILAPLARRLSPFHREELRRELREHLWARVDAYRELGQPEVEAVTEALRQFGGAKDFTRHWRREWMIAARSTARRELWQATLAGMRLSLPTLMLACTPVIIWVSQAPLYGHPIPWLKPWLEGHSTLLGSTLAWMDFVALPAALGIAIGRRTPQCAGLGAFIALAGEAVIGAVLDGTGLKWWPKYPVVNDVLGQAALLELAWLPIACLTATLTGWAIRRSKIRRLA